MSLRSVETLDVSKLQDHIDKSHLKHEAPETVDTEQLAEFLIDIFTRVIKDQDLAALKEDDLKNIVRLMLDSTLRVRVKGLSNDTITAIISYFLHPHIYFSSVDYSHIRWNTKPFMLSTSPEHTKVINHPLDPDEKVTLHRIIYLIDYPETYTVDIKAGQVGGWVSADVFEKMSPHAMVLDEAMVFDQVVLNNEALVANYAQVFHHVTLGTDQEGDDIDVNVRGYARVFNRVTITARGVVEGMVSIFTPDGLEGETQIRSDMIDAAGHGTYTGPATIEEGETYLNLDLGSQCLKLHHDLADWEN